MFVETNTKVLSGNIFITMTIAQLWLILAIYISITHFGGVSALSSTSAASVSTSSDSSTSPTLTSASSTSTDTSTTTTTDSTTSSDTPSTTTTNSTTSTNTPTTITTHIPDLTFNNVTMIVTLIVSETQYKVLNTFECNDINNRPVKVVLTTVTPSNAGCSKCFQVIQCAQSWCLKFIPNVGTLDIKQCPQYSLTVTCNNNNNYQLQTKIDVIIIPNLPPTFNQTGSSVSYAVLNTRSIKAGDIIYLVNASDPESDQLSFSMTVSPDRGNFQIDQDTGVIRATTDLMCVYDQFVTFRVFVNDKYNPKVGPLIISTSFNDTNKKPTITNMAGQIISVNENFVSLTGIFTIDTDPANATCILTTSPVQANSFFNISNKNIQLTSPLDYEAPIAGYQIITLFVKAVDGYKCVSETQSIQILVIDVNEPPTMIPNVWTRTVYEGLISLPEPWNAYDPDANDVLTYSLIPISPNKSDFIIDSVSGAIRSKGDYDIDGGNSPSTVTLMIKVTDKQQLSANGTLTINVLDSNDNAPVISPNYFSFIMKCQPVGSRLGSLSIRDKDSSFQGNNDVYFEMQTSKYFVLLSDGSIVLTSPIPLNDYSSATVYASDRGLYPKPLRSTPGFITVWGDVCDTTTAKTTKPTTTTTTTPTTTTTETTTPANTTMETLIAFNDFTDNLPWVAASAILGTCFIGLLTFFVCKCARAVCRRLRRSAKIKRLKEPQQVKPKTPPEVKVHPETTKPNPVQLREPSPFIIGPQDTKLYDFWSRQFN